MTSRRNEISLVNTLKNFFLFFKSKSYMRQEQTLVSIYSSGPRLRHKIKTNY